MFYLSSSNKTHDYLNYLSSSLFYLKKPNYVRMKCGNSKLDLRCLKWTVQNLNSTKLNSFYYEILPNFRTKKFYQKTLEGFMSADGKIQNYRMSDHVKFLLFSAKQKNFNQKIKINFMSMKRKTLNQKTCAQVSSPVSGKGLMRKL